MSMHQSTIGKDQRRFTPRWLLDPLGLFPTDACAGDPRPWDIGTERNVTAAQNCLTMDWRGFGRTWMNPPFDRRGVGEFVRLMCGHDHGVMLLHVRTETAWFKPIFETASALLFLGGRVIFCNADGTPCRIENPLAKHYGKIANSGAPVVLCAFGMADAAVLDGCGLDGNFVPLRFARYYVIPALADDADGATWRELVSNALRGEEGAVRVSALYRLFRDHPKTKSNPNWQAKLRQTLARGAGRSVGRDQWMAA